MNQSDEKSVCYIGLGSNLQSPMEQIKSALRQLATLPHSCLLMHSSLYRTVPVDCIPQPDFINAVACIATALTPHELLIALQRLEHQHGRIRPAERNAPRSLDLDILLYGNLQMTTDDLIVPHPRLTTRAFVLCPLAEIAPDLVLPNGKKLRVYLEEVSHLGVQKL